MALKYDQEANSVYISLTKDKRKVTETIPLGDNRFFDVDETGRILGIEIILPKKTPREIEEVLFRSKDEIELVQ